MKRYTEEHEWIELEGNIAAVGITEHAQDELGDIVFVELPEMAMPVDAGEGFAVIESVKAVANVYAPLSGTVVEVNEELEDAPQAINENAESVWIAKLEVADDAELEGFMDEEQYLAFARGAE